MQIQHIVYIVYIVDKLIAIPHTTANRGRAK